MFLPNLSCSGGVAYPKTSYHIASCHFRSHLFRMIYSFSFLLMLIKRPLFEPKFRVNAWRLKTTCGRPDPESIFFTEHRERFRIASTSRATSMCRKSFCRAVRKSLGSWKLKDDVWSLFVLKRTSLRRAGCRLQKMSIQGQVGQLDLPEREVWPSYFSHKQKSGRVARHTALLRIQWHGQWSRCGWQR